MSEFKIGEKVTINKVFSDDPIKARIQQEDWQPEMDDFIGRIGIIRSLSAHKDGFHQVETTDINGAYHYWYYAQESLTKFIENPMARINTINKIKERNKQNEK